MLSLSFLAFWLVSPLLTPTEAFQLSVGMRIAPFQARNPSIVPILATQDNVTPPSEGSGPPAASSDDRNAALFKKMKIVTSLNAILAFPFHYRSSIAALLGTSVWHILKGAAEKNRMESATYQRLLVSLLFLHFGSLATAPWMFGSRNTKALLVLTNGIPLFTAFSVWNREKLDIRNVWKNSFKIKRYTRTYRNFAAISLLLAYTSFDNALFTWNVSWILTTDAVLLLIFMLFSTGTS